MDGSEVESLESENLLKKKIPDCFLLFWLNPPFGNSRPSGPGDWVEETKKLL